MVVVNRLEAQLILHDRIWQHHLSLVSSMLDLGRTNYLQRMGISGSTKTRNMGC